MFSRNHVEARGDERRRDIQSIRSEKHIERDVAEREAADAARTQKKPGQKNVLCANQHGRGEEETASEIATPAVTKKKRRCGQRGNERQLVGKRRSSPVPDVRQKTKKKRRGDACSEAKTKGSRQREHRWEHEERSQQTHGA